MKFKTRDEALSWISKRAWELLASDQDIGREEIGQILSNELSVRCGLIVQVTEGQGDDDFNILLPLEAIEK